MQLEIKEPLDETIYATPPSLPEVSPIHLNTVHSNLVQVTSSHGSDLDLSTPVMSNQEEGKGKGKKRGRPRRTVPSQDKVEFDGQFEIPLPTNNVAVIESVPISVHSVATVTFEPQQAPLFVQTSPSEFCTTSLPSVISHISSSPLKSHTLLATPFTSQPSSTTQLMTQSSIISSPHLVSQAVSPRNSISPTTNDCVGSCSHPQQAPLIIHRNKNPNICRTSLSPLTMATPNVGQQDALSGLEDSLVLHKELQPNGGNDVEHIQGLPLDDSSISSASQSIRRSPRKRTPQMVKSISLPGDTQVSTHKLPLMPKKTRKQKLTELSPSQNDDTLPSSSIYPLRGRKTRCLYETSSVPMNEADKHPVEWSVEDVAEFISNIPRCGYESTFKEHVSIVCVSAMD